ncbi:MAG: TetR/AcrR family transcriptional regulator C-terminal domain-containing protein [Halocynthiibacter sp.]
MRQIAGEVGVQAGALYLYTKDKQALLFDLMDAHMVALLEAWENADPDGAPLIRLEALVRFHIRFHMERQEAVFIAYMELRNLTSDNYSAITERRKAYEKVFEDILTDGKASGAFAVEDAHLSAMAVIAMLTGVNTWYREGGRLSLERVEEVYWDMVRKSLAC